MRKTSAATVAMILGVSFYFTLTFGLEGLRLLASPNYGLEDVWRSQYIFVVGRYMGLDPIGLIKLAAFFGALKLAIAAVCLFHIGDRLRHLSSGAAKSEILEAALILIVGVSILGAGPALWSQNADLVREQVLTLALAALTTALCMVERRRQTPEEPVEEATTETPAYSGPAVHP